MNTTTLLLIPMCICACSCSSTSAKNRGAIRQEIEAIQQELAMDAHRLEVRTRSLNDLKGMANADQVFDERFERYRDAKIEEVYPLRDQLRDLQTILERKRKGLLLVEMEVKIRTTWLINSVPMQTDDNAIPTAEP